MIASVKEMSRTSSHSLNSVTLNVQPMNNSVKEAPSLNTTVKVAAAEAQRKHIAKNMPELPPVPQKLYTAEQIAKELGTSLSYVYMITSKLKVDPLHKQGKTFLYGEDFLEELRQRPRRQRARHVKLLMNIQPATQQPNIGEHGLLARMKELEQKAAMFDQQCERVAKLEAEMLTMKHVLGMS